MGSSCMSTSNNETQSLHTNQCDFNKGFQQDVFLVHPKKVLDTISSVSSYSSINSIQSNSSPLYPNYQGVSLDQIIQNNVENTTEYNNNKRIQSKQFLQPNQCSLQNSKSNQSELSIELQENQTISLAIPKGQIQFRLNFSSQRRVYSKKDLLKRVKRVKKQRKSEVVSTIIN